MSVKYKELEIADRIMAVVDTSLKSIETGKIDAEELVRLEKLTKVYTMLMTNTRENIKHKVFANVSNLPQELTESNDGADDDGNEPD